MNSKILRKSCNSKAVETKLETYLDWRKNSGLDYKQAKEDLSDEAAWEYAVKRAYDIEESLAGTKQPTDTFEETACNVHSEKKSEDACELDEQGEEGKNAPSDRADIDQVIFFHKSEDGEPLCDKAGKRIMHLLPARINPGLAAAATYANVFAIYLDHSFDRSSTEKVTILVDIRSGEGWANTPVLAMMKVLSNIIKVFEYNFPERVEKFVVFPVPRIARGIFNAIKLLFDSNTANKIVLVAGSDGVDAPVPKEDIEEHIEGGVMDQTEQARLSYFRPPIG
jgi:hypothetical protein